MNFSKRFTICTFLVHINNYRSSKCLLEKSQHPMLQKFLEIPIVQKKKKKLLDQI